MSCHVESPEESGGEEEGGRERLQREREELEKERKLIQENTGMMEEVTTPMGVVLLITTCVYVCRRSTSYLPSCRRRWKRLGVRVKRWTPSLVR